MIVLDTHVVVWWVSGTPRLSARARRTIDQAVRAGPVTASAITVFEIATAARRGRLELSMPIGTWLADLRALPELRFEPVSAGIAQLAAELDDTTPGDPADRIIVATALATGAKLVTADERLRGLREIATVW